MSAGTPDHDSAGDVLRLAVVLLLGPLWLAAGILAGLVLGLAFLLGKIPYVGMVAFVPLFLLGGALGMVYNLGWLHLALFFRKRIACDDSGVTIRRRWIQRRRVPWSDVASAQKVFDPPTWTCTLSLRDGRAIAFDALVQTDALLRAMRERNLPVREQKPDEVSNLLAAPVDLSPALQELAERARRVDWAAWPAPTPIEEMPSVLVSVGSAGAAGDFGILSLRLRNALGCLDAEPFWPILVPTLPFLGEFLGSDSPVARAVALDLLTDLVPAVRIRPEHERFMAPDGRIVVFQQVVRDWTRDLQPRLRELAESEAGAVSERRIAAELARLIAKRNAGEPPLESTTSA